MATLSDRLEKILNDKEISYQELADRINSSEYKEGAKITKSMIADIINAPLHPEKKVREPGYKTIIKIAKALDMSVDYLLGVTDIEMTTDDNENEAAYTTGLSGRSISQLKYMKNNYKEFSEYAGILEMLIDNLYQWYINYNESQIKDDEKEGYAKNIINDLGYTDVYTHYLGINEEYATGTALESMRKYKVFNDFLKINSFSDNSGFTAFVSNPLPEDQQKEKYTEQHGFEKLALKNPDGSVFTVESNTIQYVLLEELRNSIGDAIGSLFYYSEALYTTKLQNSR